MEAEAKIEAVGWACGVEDAIKVVNDKKKYLEMMGPARGVIWVLDELVVHLQAMQQRGHYSDLTHSLLMEGRHD